MRIFRRGKNWGIDYSVGGRRIRERVGPNRRMAERALAKVKTAIFENRYFDIRKESKITFSEMIRQYLEVYAKPNKRSWKGDERVLRRLETEWGNIPISQITQKMVEELKARRTAELSKSTVNRHLACLKTCLGKAIQWGHLEHNPVKGIKFFNEESFARKRFLERGQWEMLLDASPHWLKPVLAIAVNTGMRQSEILSLAWQDVDFNTRQIHVKNSKSGEGRFIPMNETVEATLKAVKPIPESPYVFTDPNGRPLKRLGRLRVHFQKAVRAAGLRDFRFHDLRHTFGSQMAMRGVDLFTIAKLMGHKSGVRMTERYAHLSHGHLQDAVGKLDGFSRQVGTNLAQRHEEGQSAQNKYSGNITEKSTKIAKEDGWQSGQMHQTVNPPC